MATTSPKMPPDDRVSSEESRARMRERLPEAAAVGLALVVGIAIWLGTRYVDQTSWVQHSLQVETKISRVWSLLQDAEIGQRSYALTGEERFLRPFIGAEQSLAIELDALAKLVADNAAHVAAVAAARPVIAERLAIASRTVELRRQGNFDGARALVQEGRGFALMNDLRGRFETMRREEARLLDIRIAAVRATILILSGAILIALLGTVYVLFAWIVNTRDSSRELAASNAALRMTIAEREAAENQLRHVQKMEAVGQLTGGIAHDFNNMLAVIVSGITLARRRMSKGEPGADGFLEGALGGARRAADLVSRLLAFARKQPLAPEPIDPNKFVSRMSELITRSLGETIRMETILGAGLWNIHVDSPQLETAILNLCVNARDAMPDGGRLTLETANCHLDDGYSRQHPGVPAGQYVLIAVTDTGSGMSPDVIANAFDPFFTTKEPGKGTGLGLSQVFGFVRQSGGHVKIYSEPGQGTTVKLYMPRHYGPAAERPVAVAQTEQRGIETILLVEDNADVLSFTATTLRELGYTVIETRHAKDALAALDTGRHVDLLLTDIVMPDINGRKLAEMATQRVAGLKCMFMTGFTKNAVVHNGVLDPGVHFLAKPFTIEDLSRKVREAIGTKIGT